MKLGRSLSITAICLLLGTMLAWQYKSLYNNKKIETSQRVSLNGYKDEYLAARKNVDDLTKRNEELLKTIEGYENNTKIDQQLREDLDRARILAGLYDVKGAGIEITLDNFENDVLHYDIEERDLITIINELKASGAQAISVNGERIVAMSEIRGTGDFIIINGKQMIPPFKIKAIAEPEKLENALNILGGISAYFKEYFIFEIEKRDSIVIQKVRDDGSVLKYNLLEPVK
ncbi:MAG: DUF881 domain-containing protein [Clostridiaceae bacterium]|nr:DUF881 domain-containing protein [Clostridiaceae bacterium]